MTLHRAFQEQLNICAFSKKHVNECKTKWMQFVKVKKCSANINLNYTLNEELRFLYLLKVNQLKFVICCLLKR